MGIDQWKLGAASASILLVSLSSISIAATTVTSATVTADATQITADAKTVAADQQQIQTVLLPARKTLSDAQKKFDTDAAPYRAQITALEEQWKQMLKADADAIESARATNEPLIAAAVQKHKANQARRDKAATAQSETELRAARQKRDDDVKAAQDKHKADSDQRDQAITAAKSAMDIAMQPDADALKAAQEAVNVASIWVTKLDADRAVLKADRAKLEADKQTLAAQQK